MKTVYSKALVVVVTVLGGLILYRVSMQFGETLRSMNERHPDIGVTGWLLFALWGASAVAIGLLGEHFWKGRTLFIPGDLPMAVMLLYMTVSALIYMVSFGA